MLDVDGVGCMGAVVEAPGGIIGGGYWGLGNLLFTYPVIAIGFLYTYQTTPILMSEAKISIIINKIVLFII